MESPQQKRQRHRLMTSDAWTPRDVANWLALCGVTKFRARQNLGVTAMTMNKFARQGLPDVRSRRTVLAMRYLLEHKAEWR